MKRLLPPLVPERGLRVPLVRRTVGPFAERRAVALSVQSRDW